MVIIWNLYRANVGPDPFYCTDLVGLAYRSLYITHTGPFKNHLQNHKGPISETCGGPMQDFDLEPLIVKPTYDQYAEVILVP